MATYTVLENVTWSGVWNDLDITLSFNAGPITPNAQQQYALDYFLVPNGQAKNPYGETGPWARRPAPPPVASAGQVPVADGNGGLAFQAAGTGNMNDRGAWAANTSYAVNDVVVAPDGTVQLCVTAHTSGASFTPSYWAQRGVQSGAYVPTSLDWKGTPTTGNNSFVNLTHDGTTAGYLFHLVGGANGVAGNAMVGIGIGENGSTAEHGILIAHRTSSGDAIIATNQAGTTGHLLHLEHQSTSASAAYLESVNSTGASAPLLTLVNNGTAGSGQMLMVAQSVSVAARSFGHDLLRLYADTGTFDVVGPLLRANGALVTVQTADPNNTGTQNRVDIQPGTSSVYPAVVLRGFSSGNTFWSGRITPAPPGIEFDVSNGAAAIGSETWLKALTLSASGGKAEVGFYGATAVVQPTAAAVTAGYTAGTSTAVTIDGKFTGNVGTTAYTLGDVVAALKNLGLVAA